MVLEKYDTIITLYMCCDLIECKFFLCQRAETHAIFTFTPYFQILFCGICVVAMFVFISISFRLYLAAVCMSFVLFSSFCFIYFLHNFFFRFSLSFCIFLSSAVISMATILIYQIPKYVTIHSYTLVLRMMLILRLLPEFM